eukprot:14169798-Alexandrium_andersonii.AAC.1
MHAARRCPLRSEEAPVTQCSSTHHAVRRGSQFLAVSCSPRGGLPLPGPPPTLHRGPLLPSEPPPRLAPSARRRELSENIHVL